MVKGDRSNFKEAFGFVNGPIPNVSQTTLNMK